MRTQPWVCPNMPTAKVHTLAVGVYIGTRRLDWVKVLIKLLEIALILFPFVIGAIVVATKGWQGLFH